MLSSEDYKLIEEAARRDNMTVEEWAEATLIKDAQKRMKNYYDDEISLPEDVSLAAEVPEEYGAPRRSRPLLPAASRGNKSWRAWHPADVPPLSAGCCPGGYGKGVCFYGNKPRLESSQILSFTFLSRKKSNGCTGSPFTWQSTASWNPFARGSLKALPCSGHGVPGVPF